MNSTMGLTAELQSKLPTLMQESVLLFTEAFSSKRSKLASVDGNSKETQTELWGEAGSPLTETDKLKPATTLTATLITTSTTTMTNQKKGASNSNASAGNIKLTRQSTQRLGTSKWNATYCKTNVSRLKIVVCTYFIFKSYFYTYVLCIFEYTYIYSVATCSEEGQGNQDVRPCGSWHASFHIQ